MNLLSTVFAQEPLNIDSQVFTDASIYDASIGDWISWAITIVLIVAAVIFFFMLVIGGIRWITSGGDKANTEGARNQITAALIGLIVVFAAWAIATLIGNVFGVSIFEEFTIPALGTTG